MRHSGKPLHLHSLRLFGNSIVQAVNDHPHGSALNLLCPRVSSEITVEVILCKYSRQIHSQTKLASEESAQANCGFRQARPDRQVRKLIKLTLPPLGERQSFWKKRFLFGKGTSTQRHKHTRAPRRQCTSAQGHRRTNPPAHQGTRNRKRRCTQGTHAQRAHVTPKGVPRLVACSTRATRESQ